MCFSSPSVPDTQKEVAPPPPPPPAPAQTAQGLTVGADRRTAPIQRFLKTALGAKKRNSSLTIPLGGTDAAGGNGVNIPVG